ncbi:MAG: class I SAM-dependent methyltransferase [Acidimicrobiales bacterium]|nr:class I SAM-dependent methyltransferase [Acidimicrobiales bacterium]MCB9395288.1 class I SAM-dependent methyltransferase [Acidimicrobiaceae bacterium]
MRPSAVLSSLPAPAARRLAVRATPDAIRRLKAGHPWLFEGSIRSVSHEGSPGDLAVVFDDDRQFVAIGLWDPDSPIRLKVLHQGKPAPIDEAWMRARIEAAVARRHPIAMPPPDTPPTTAYRVVHGENDGLPGLVVDRYAHVAVVKLYSAAWVAHLPVVVPILREVVSVSSIVLRLARSIPPHHLHGLEEGQSLVGPEISAPVSFLEHGLRFEADVVAGQKTGHFLDQRDNRIEVGRRARGARVLDVFSCTGGFGVHAAAGGARSVLSVDANPQAIAMAERHMSLNMDRPDVAACRHETVTGDAFGALERLAAARRRFDIVVVDPPSFAPNAASVPRALSAYERLAQLSAPLVEIGGLLVSASCSSRVTLPDFVRAVHAGAAKAGFELDEERRTEHPIDHPIGFAEGAYLKAVWSRPRKSSGAFPPFDPLR